MDQTGKSRPPKSARKTPDRADNGTPFSQGSHSQKGGTMELPAITDKRQAGKPSNPFHMPSDEEVFARRDEERKKKEDERRRQLSLPVHMKGTWTSRSTAVDKEFLKHNIESERILKDKKRDVGTTEYTKDRHEKENMADFIAKKREMFLVQMSLDTKRADIRKLEEQAQQREEALRKSEQMLDEDSVRFDAFLKENDYKAVEAIRKAEAETKAKQDKVQEIKKLNAQIAQVKSEMSKYEEQLEDCKRYRDFLNMLTPPEWKQEQAEKRRLRREERRAKKEAELAARLAEEEAAREAEAKKAEAKAEKGDKPVKGDKAAAKKKKDDVKKDKKVASSKDAASLVASSTTASDKKGDTLKAALDASMEDDEDSEEEMYFKRPEQLLEIFAALEERNLFLIQNSQETEGALEELKQKLEETRGKMDAETDTLKNQITSLKLAIQAEHDKAMALSERAKPQTHIANGGQQDTDSLLEQLKKRVTEVYERCDFEMDAPLGTLGMLANIEAKLEEYLGLIFHMNPEYVAEAEKDKERERRQRVREEKMDQQRKIQEERIKRSIERSKAPVKKKTGKAVMFRAPPLTKRRREKEVDVKKDDEDEDIREFFTE